MHETMQDLRWIQDIKGGLFVPVILGLATTLVSGRTASGAAAESSYLDDRCLRYLFFAFSLWEILHQLNQVWAMPAVMEILGVLEVQDVPLAPCSQWMLARWGMQHPGKCLLCGQEEDTIQHLMPCVFSQQVWAVSLDRAGLQHLAPSQRDADFQVWWRKASRRTATTLRKGFNSPVTLRA
jgi:hypothetical protein